MNIVSQFTSKYVDRTESMLIDPSSIDELSTRLAFLQEHIQEDILLALSLWLTFNDADGD